ncbi:uncharacterized protein LOC124435104 [Xenia sp. Carnegie-2017]|uniref:uncharacterized protein LOC124435104 n=1 Tax=Xenia sp. Carnegie-2017 TaxID=2897299 RepID=UPI001F049729|nr:uncharacterized protein LOC124435104 [Xenia sp. Carnegie-2017]
MSKGKEASKKTIDILSLDGGGSRGILELKILDDVLRLATIVLRNPDDVSCLVDNDEKEVDFLKDSNVREFLIDFMDGVEDPIHPTDLYDMIVGTSTGGLIAFGLVGGNKIDGDDSKREQMSVDECIEMYRKKIKQIFKKSRMQKFLSHTPKLPNIPFKTYSKAKLEKVLKDQFGDCKLEDFRNIDNLKCVAGAVAKKLGSKQELVLFDTANEDYKLYPTYQVLLATSNAPIYFDTPVRIGDDEFVDGGVGGNCPLAQAIPQAMKLFGKDGEHVRIASALSIAPPSLKLKTPHSLSTWLRYFVNEVTDGNAVYRNVVERNEQTLFQRLSPRGESLKKFKLDESNAERMLDAMQKVKNDEAMYIVDVVASAMFVVLTSINKGQEHEENSLTVAAQLAKAAAHAYRCSEEYESAISSYQTCKSMLREKSSDFIMIKISYHIATCQKELGNFQLAIKLFESNENKLFDYLGEPSVDLFFDNFMQKVCCYTSTFYFKNAEKHLIDILYKYSDDNEKQLLVHIKVAWCRQRLGKLNEALNTYREAANFVADNDVLNMAEILNGVGLCFLYLGLVTEAYQLLCKARELRMNLSVGDNLSQNKKDRLIAESLHNVGLSLIEKKDYIQAISLLNKAKQKFNETNDELNMAMVLSNLAKCMSLIKNPEHSDALAYAQQALAKLKKIVHFEQNPGIARAFLHLSVCLSINKKFKDAKESLLKALDIINLFLSDNHPWLLDVYEQQRTV